MGLLGLEQAYVAGFAVGIVLLGQVPAIALRKRIVSLETQLAAAQPTMFKRMDDRTGRDADRNLLIVCAAIRSPLR